MNSTARLRRLIILLFLAVADVGAALGQTHDLPVTNDFPPIINLVPDEKTAVAIAIAVLRPIYGDKLIKVESPFHAKLNGDNWIVEGSLSFELLGGVATVQLMKDDARIIKIHHTK
jgi:hypothetical protein